MKTSAFIFGLIALLSGSLASASSVCGYVEISDSCDVDQCSIHFVTKDYVSGQTSALAMSADGQILNHDYQVSQYKLENLLGRQLCVRRETLSPSYPVVDILDLVGAY